MPHSLDSQRGSSEADPPTLLARSVANSTSPDCQKEAGGSTAPPAARHIDTATMAGAIVTPVAIPDGLSIHGYEILEVLGRGAMGVVYKARQPGLKRIVALKMILAGDLAGRDELLRFRSEAEVIARLHHANIVQVFEIGEDDGRPFFSMEYVDGLSLSKTINATPQAPREAARIIQLLAQAIQTAHNQKIIHRDIKPANILISQDGTLKISDFGLAKTLENHSSQTHSGAILGTPSYMSPEQAEGRVDAIGVHCDIYSLGAVLYELLTGRAPFKAGTVLDTLQQVKTLDPIAPRQLAPGVPRDLETICLKCLQKDPHRRYDSAMSLANDLSRFLAGESILGRPISTPERAWRWCRRHPREAALTAVIVLALLSWGTTTSILALSLKHEKDNTETARIAAVQNAQQADENAQAAQRNAEQAEQNAKEARDNARRARENETAARANAELAQRHAASALQNYQTAMSRMMAMGQKLQKRLSVRQMGSAPEMRQARDELLKIVRESILAMGKDLENAELTSFATAAAHQQLGDLLARLGLGQEALEQYRKAYDAVKRVADAQPANDRARANLAVMLMRLGSLSLELLGDAPLAVRYHREARALLQEIADRPRSKDYTVIDCKRMLSHADMHLGKTLLTLGQLQEAHQLFEECLNYRKYWFERDSRNHLAESFVSDAWLWLGLAVSRQGDLARGASHLATAATIKDSLVSRFPRLTDYRTELIEILGHQGDLKLRAGRADDAANRFLEIRDHLVALHEQDAEDSVWQLHSALLHERQAARARLQGEDEEASRHDHDALAIWVELRQIEPNHLTWKAYHARALARAGQLEKAQGLAEEVARRCADNAAILLEVGRTYAICAHRERDCDKQSQLIQKATDALDRSVAAGWKDRLTIESDPDLALLRDRPSYRQLLEKLPTD